MNILPYKLTTTNDQLTSRAGLLAIGDLMGSLRLAERIDQSFPAPRSNRGFKPSVFVQTLMLMQQDGHFHLEDVRHLREDTALKSVLDIKTVPHANALGNWLRRMGGSPGIQQACTQVNRVLLKSALHQCKGITLDIDATEIVANKSSAKWSYKKNKGYMPMVGHIAETGQVLATDFRHGNACPAKENFEFIEQCAKALPAACFIKSLRIDSAGYQQKIIEHCDKNKINYAIRAKLVASLKNQLEALDEDQWKPLLNKRGKAVEGQSTHRTSHVIGDYEHAFTLVVQRTCIQGQAELDLETPAGAEEIRSQGYIYRAIATNRDDLTDSALVHWYNQRGEDSENRIKELKLDFGGDTLPCSDFQANALYFSLTALAYNLFALMRHLLPEQLSRHRAGTIRYRLYAMAAKVVKTGRQLYVKLQAKNQTLLEEVLVALRRFKPPPI